MTQLENPPVFDPYSAAFLADRYSAYRQVRDETPLLSLGSEPPTVLLSRYADVEKALRDSAVRMLPPGAGAPPWLGDGLRQVTSPAFAPGTSQHCTLPSTPLSTSASRYFGIRTRSTRRPISQSSSRL